MYDRLSGLGLRVWELSQRSENKRQEARTTPVHSFLSSLLAPLFFVSIVFFLWVCVWIMDTHTHPRSDIATRYTQIDMDSLYITYTFKTEKIRRQ